MIYKLPTQAERAYRGRFPTAVHSWSGSRVIHCELNNGSRYVLTPDELSFGLRMGRRLSLLSLTLEDMLADSEGNPREISTIPEMSLSDYAGIVLVTRIIRRLRYPSNQPQTLDQAI